MAIIAKLNTAQELVKDEYIFAFPGSKHAPFIADI